MGALRDAWTALRPRRWRNPARLPAEEIMRAVAHGMRGWQGAAGIRPTGPLCSHICTAGGVEQRLPYCRQSCTSCMGREHVQPCKHRIQEEER